MPAHFAHFGNVDYSPTCWEECFQGQWSYTASSTYP